jgi:hypothetical protein
MLSMSLWVEIKDFVPGIALEVRDAKVPSYNDIVCFSSGVLQWLMLSLVV